MHFEQALKNPIFKTIASCAAALETPCYVVGGYVRDFILSRHTSQDIDVVAIGNGIELAESVAKALPNAPKVSICLLYTSPSPRD